MRLTCTRVHFSRVRSNQLAHLDGVVHDPGLPRRRSRKTALIPDPGLTPTPTPYSLARGTRLANASQSSLGTCLCPHAFVRALSAASHCAIVSLSITGTRSLIFSKKSRRVERGNFSSRSPSITRRQNSTKCLAVLNQGLSPDASSIVRRLIDPRYLTTRCRGLLFTLCDSTNTARQCGPQ